MKKLITVILLWMVSAQILHAQANLPGSAASGAAKNFTGEVWVHMLVETDTVYNSQIGNVTFAPGARSNWHSHPSGQILLVREGLGITRNACPFG